MAFGQRNFKQEDLTGPDYFGSPADLWDNFESEKYNLTMLEADTISKLSRIRISFEENA